jgi:hypothetical protein
LALSSPEQTPRVRHISHEYVPGVAADGGRTNVIKFVIKRGERRVQVTFMQRRIYLLVWGAEWEFKGGLFMGFRLVSASSAAIMLSLVCIHSANAEGGCGPGFHRGPYGACRPNRGPVVVVPGAPVVVAPAVVAPAVVAPAPVVCGPGLRWHPGLRRCVVL